MRHEVKPVSGGCWAPPRLPFVTGPVRGVHGQELRVEPLLLCVERSQLSWFGHLIRMSPRCLPLEASPWRCSGHIIGADRRDNPSNEGLYIPSGLGYPRGNWKVSLG